METRRGVSGQHFLSTLFHLLFICCWFGAIDRSIIHSSVLLWFQSSHCAGLRCWMRNCCQGKTGSFCKTIRRHRAINTYAAVHILALMTFLFVFWFFYFSSRRSSFIPPSFLLFQSPRAAHPGRMEHLSSPSRYQCPSDSSLNFGEFSLSLSPYSPSILDVLIRPVSSLALPLLCPTRRMDWARRNGGNE